MSDVADAGRDQRGRFLTGGKPGPGRRVGSKNKLSESFLADLADCWARNGVAALEQCAQQQPEVLIRTIASLLPKDVNLNLGLDAATFATSFTAALNVLGVEPSAVRRPLPGKKNVLVLDAKKATDAQR